MTRSRPVVVSGGGGPLRSYRKFYMVVLYGGFCTSLAGLVTQMGIVLACLSVVVAKHQPKATPGRKGFIWLSVYSPLLREARTEAKRPQRRLGDLFDTAQVYLPRDHAAHHALGLHVSVKQCHTDKATSHLMKATP